MQAQQQHALLIGINKYNPPEGEAVSEIRDDFPDLSGPVNDVATIKSIIQARYNFAAANITTLIDEQASRKNMLKAFDDLLEKSNRGDIAFIFYAGHGSQVKNTLSAEKDKVDESMVPADYWKPGVQDIRDKTLSAVFNKFIDKGVILTCIFDCCHSGSLQRGFQAQPPHARYMKSPSYDAKDPSKPLRPESRPGNNFLIISACQDNERAMEIHDTIQGAYGIFTNSLALAMLQQSPDAPVYTLFTATTALITTRLQQSPVIAGDKSRINGTLFGIAKVFYLIRTSFQ